MCFSKEDSVFPYIVKQFTKKRPVLAVGSLMKIFKGFRVNQDLSDKAINFASSQGISFSQLVELALYSFMEEKPLASKAVSKSKKLEKIDLQFSLDQPTYKDLVRVVRNKNSTLSQEVYYRLSASLTNPIFDTIEFKQLSHLHFDLNRLGNLLKLAINNKMPVDLTVLESIRKDIQAVSDEIDKALTHTRKRTL